MTRFTAEQQAYLFETVTRLGLDRAFQAATGTAAPETVHGTPVEDLCREEVRKYETHPCDLWDAIEDWTERGVIAEGLDQFLLRHWGFFNVEPADTGYMCRLRLPGCRLRGDQMMAVAEIAERLAGGFAHVTTRGNLQLRNIAPRDVLAVHFALKDAGLSCHGSGADSARNITASPTGGFDADELIDLTPQARALGERIANTRDLQGLPRKFNIAFDGGGRVSCVADSNDICFQAVRVTDGLKPGIWLRVAVGGISGHLDLARPTGAYCRPEDAVQVAVAMLRVFVEHGDRTNRKRARLKYLLDRHGVDWFIDCTIEKLPDGKLVLATPNEAQRAPIDRQGHIGVHPQRDGARYLGVALEMGRLSPEQMRLLGRLSLDEGRNDLRLTVWQNLLLPHVPEGRVETIRTALAGAGMPAVATAFAAGAVGCTGKWACKFGLAYTKADGTALVRHLEARFTLDRPINIHLTGCPNSCAQHYIGDIGLMGATLPDGGEGYMIVLGGGTDDDEGLARPLSGPIPAAALNTTVETVVGSYLAQRAPGESFLAFVRRLPDEAMPTLLDRDIAVA
ncbi:ferredoxin-nitrite reductase [Palleronia aestuarii]|uniref:Ferredoxin-nitrite reductase n=1 Tax=Palleronia aestuarii TaxID=568105 RepID=A0A2W7NAT9_9RHOB|nr:NirA family protein [Palleronia aestuarii]PZX10116.1 ferredoxin-nitrite reductase [Palleronia aestuarii]